MAQNRASKYASKVAERFSLKSVTEGAFSNDYDWKGVDTVNVYSVGTATMQAYAVNGDNRYGVIEEVDTTIQTLTLSRDRGFTKSIDRRNLDASMGAQEAGKFLARQLDEVITPEIDVYRLATLYTAATANSATGTPAALSTSNGYSSFLDTNKFLTNKKVPLTGRIAFMTPGHYNFLKQSNYVLASEAGMASRKSGSLGTVDGVEVRVVPDSYMPTNVTLIIVHPSAVVSPMVLADYVTHKNPRGVNGWVVEGRVVYDCFVLTAKIDGVASFQTS